MLFLVYVGGGGVTTLFYTTLLPFFVNGVVKSVVKKSTLNHTYLQLFRLNYTFLQILLFSYHFPISFQISKGKTRVFNLCETKMSMNYTFLDYFTLHFFALHF